MQALSPNIKSVADPYNPFPPLVFVELLLLLLPDVGVPTLILTVTLAVAPPDPVGVSPLGTVGDPPPTIKVVGFATAVAEGT
jgi:hypothetical protein